MTWIYPVEKKSEAMEQIITSRTEGRTSAQTTQ